MSLGWQLAPYVSPKAYTTFFCGLKHVLPKITLLLPCSFGLFKSSQTSEVASGLSKFSSLYYESGFS